MQTSRTKVDPLKWVEKKTRMEINKMTRIKRKERKIQINIYLSKFNAPRDVIHDFT